MTARLLLFRASFATVVLARPRAQWLCRKGWAAGRGYWSPADAAAVPAGHGVGEDSHRNGVIVPPLMKFVLPHEEERAGEPGCPGRVREGRGREGAQLCSASGSESCSQPSPPLQMSS